MSRSTMRGRLVPGLAAVAAASVVLTGCGGGGTGASSTAADTLTIGIPLPPQSLDPGKDGGGGQNVVQWLTYEPLIRLGSDGSYSPGLATAWQYVGTGNTAFELTIRTDAQFADGTPVTAQAVADTINRYLANPGPLSHYLTGVTAASVKDPSTVAIALDQPNPILPTVFSQVANWGDVISPAGLATPDQLTTQTFGAGPYTLDAAGTVAGDHYTFTRNPGYWNADAVTYDTVVVKVLPDPNAALQSVRSGQTQIMLSADGKLADQAGSAGIDVVTGPGHTVAAFLMDRAGAVAPALADPRVRQALNLAVDRAAVAKALGTGYTPTAQIAPEGTDGHDADLDETYPYDVDRAKELLAEAGYPDGFELSLLSTSLMDIDTVSQALAGQLAEIGVTVTTKSVGADLNQLIADMAGKQYPAVSFITGGDMYPNALQNFASPVSPLNPFASTDPAVTAAFTALAAAPESERDAAAAALNRAVTEAAWFVPVAQTESYLFSKGVAGIDTYGDGGLIDVLSVEPAS
jgi:peptide/nickel transport system substrate-binding protein